MNGKVEIYWEDIAFEIKSKKYQTIRLIICGILIFLIFINSLTIFGTYLIQNQNMQENNRIIAEQQGILQGIEADIENLSKASEAMEYYYTAEIGDLVAQAQSQYGGFGQYDTTTEITEAAKGTADLLDNYIYSGQGRTPWYQNAKRDYTWTYLNRQTSVVDKVPCIWACSDNNVLLAITTGMYDGTNKQFGDFKTYYTANGYSLMADNTMLNNQGVVVELYDSQAQYEDVMDIQASVAKKAGEIKETSTEVLTETDTEVSTETDTEVSTETDTEASTETDTEVSTETSE